MKSRYLLKKNIRRETLTTPAIEYFGRAENVKIINLKCFQERQTWFKLLKAANLKMHSHERLSELLCICETDQFVIMDNMGFFFVVTALVHVNKHNVLKKKKEFGHELCSSFSDENLPSRVAVTLTSCTLPQQQ